MTETVELLATSQGRNRILTLSRPRGLNAVSPSMLEAFLKEIRDWEEDVGSDELILDSSSKRAFCAGADVRAARDNVLARQPEMVLRYFTDEYEIQRRLHESRKPTIALVEGVCMGAGMGFAVNSCHSLMSTTAVLAMPETSIGFFPDAGATCFLNRLSPPLALYLGLTGARLTGADAVRLGLATHLVAEGDFEAAAQVVRREGHTALPVQQGDLPVLSFQDDLPLIEDCFSAGSIAAIHRKLIGAGTDRALDIAAQLKQMSPNSLEITHQLLTEARGRPLRECLALEVEAVREIVAHPDFVEGIRALLVDKDRNPAWA